MGFCYHIYTPDMIERDSGKIVACDILLDNKMVFPSIAYNVSYYGKEYSDIHDSVYLLNKDACKIADNESHSTFFSDFLNEYNCNGILVRIT